MTIASERPRSRDERVAASDCTLVRLERWPCRNMVGAELHGAGREVDGRLPMRWMQSALWCASITCAVAEVNSLSSLLTALAGLRDEFLAEAAERRKWMHIPCQSDQAWHVADLEGWAERLNTLLQGVDREGEPMKNRQQNLKSAQHDDLTDVDVRYCNCADPENCREPIPEYACRPRPASSPVHGEPSRREGWLRKQFAQASADVCPNCHGSGLADPTALPAAQHPRSRDERV